MALPSDAAERKTYPISTGFLDYFPDAIAEVAKVSYTGNIQHNPGQSLRWDKSKSQDEADCAIRHHMQRFDMDTDGTYHAAKACWRQLAFLQKLIEAKRHNITYEEYNTYLKTKTPPRQIPCGADLQNITSTMREGLGLQQHPFLIPLSVSPQIPAESLDAKDSTEVGDATP